MRDWLRAHRLAGELRRLGIEDAEQLLAELVKLRARQRFGAWPTQPAVVQVEVASWDHLRDRGEDIEAQPHRPTAC